MENTLGIRLAKYRKIKGLSQEELAFKLDVSRQAVSKWERDEASPDTNNLIALAKIYGVSLDDLLYKDPEEVKFKEKKQEETSNEETTNKNNDSNEFVSISKDGIHVIDEEDEVHVTWKGIQVKSKSKDSTNETYDYGEEKRNERFEFKDKHPRLRILKNVINGSGYLLVTIIYLILGFTLSNGTGWSVYWTLFFIPGILSSLISCFLYRKISLFNITFLCAFIYFFVGMYFGLWHPTRLMFLAIPLFYVVVENIEKVIRVTKDKKEYNEKVVDSIKE